MAYNRLWLVHRETGMAIMLGKNMAYEWYDPPETSYFQEYFDTLAEQYVGQDCFFLAIENNEYAPGITSDWMYTDEKIGNFQIIKFPAPCLKSINIP